MSKWLPLVEYKRNDISECVIHGAVSWVSGKDIIYSYSDNIVCYARSLMKPIMLKVFAKDLETELNWQQKAISIASHNGTPEHLAVMKSILNKSELNLLKTPPALPLMQSDKLIKKPSKYYHSCSGEHAAILRACKLRGWSTDNYTDPDHPLNIAYFKLLKNYLGENWSPQVIAKDGCGLPTVAMSISELATIFSYLCKEKNDDWIWQAMVKNPQLIGGLNRLDTNILEACNGQVIAKEGADGLLALSILHPDYPEGLGILIKIAHGWDSQATWYVARNILGVLGFKLKSPKPLEKQRAFVSEEIIPADLRKNLKNIPEDYYDLCSDRW